MRILARTYAMERISDEDYFYIDDAPLSASESDPWHDVVREVSASYHSSTSDSYSDPRIFGLLIGASCLGMIALSVGLFPA